jgi:sugar/nucleoside kinase (ribokinase family)
LPECDVFLPNETEACAIVGCDDLDKAVDALSTQIPTLAVKLGAQGGLARQSESVARAPALPVRVVDTTGAGDSFDAGFLYGVLKGWSLEASLRLACACGSLSTRMAGGTAGQATLEEALEALERRGNCDGEG